MAWFTLDDLKDVYPYDKVQNAPETFVTNVIIPDSERFVLTYSLEDGPNDELVAIAKNYAVNKILADDETVKIAQARGQPSFTVAGDTVTLDLTLGRNPLLSVEDEAVLLKYRQKNAGKVHTDKAYVRSDGDAYTELGHGEPVGTDYVRTPGWLSPFGSTGSGT